MKRLFDFLLSFFLFFLLFIPCLLISALIKITSNGPVLYWSDRVGKNNQIFSMSKFRTMKISTPNVATQLLKGKSLLTPIGGFLRKTSLDEIPHLWSILIGDMSFVGPRPALYNQDELIELRTKKGIHLIVPGLTGWAQINGRDDISIAAKVVLDFEYLNKRSFLFELKILFLTIIKVIIAKDIVH